MAKVDPEITRKLKSYIADIGEVCRIDKVVLFGSYAKGTQGRDSDIDLAVFSRDIDDSNRREYMSVFLRHILKYKLDIQPLAFSLKDYTRSSDAFISSEIRKRGKVLYSR